MGKKTTNLTIRIDEDLRRAVEWAAEATDRDASGYVRMALRRVLREEQIAWPDETLLARAMIPNDLDRLCEDHPYRKLRKK